MTAKNTPNPPTIYGEYSIYDIPILEKSTWKLEPALMTNDKPIDIQTKKIPVQIPISCILIIFSKSYLQIKQIQKCRHLTGRKIK
jgi:hypothetical protein